MLGSIQLLLGMRQIKLLLRLRELGARVEALLRHASQATRLIGILLREVAHVLGVGLRSTHLPELRDGVDLLWKLLLLLDRNHLLELMTSKLCLLVVLPLIDSVARPCVHVLEYVFP